MYIPANQLIKLGVKRKLLERKLTSGKWITRLPLHEGDEEAELEVLLSSLTKELQLKWAQNNASLNYPEQIAVLLSEGAKYGINEQQAEINKLLLPLTAEERIAWMAESLRLARIIERYDKIRPKRRRDPFTGAWKFVPEVLNLLKEAVCKEPIILARHPHRANPLSPHTLDDLSRAFRRKGLVALLPKVKKPSTVKRDKRRVAISQLAIRWMNDNWKHFSGPYHLYKALKDTAQIEGWKIPSKSWVYRVWLQIPKIVKEYFLEGKQVYESKSAPYVPRDNTDLFALQILCGDHSERDVTVLLQDNSIARPWLTCWYDLRTGLIWGWCLCLVPSSFTAGVAYADGVQNFGAQPLSRPADGYYSYIYTDRGRDYKSHHWNGKDIVVHKEAMRIDGGLEMLLTQRRVGILEELTVEHLFPRGRNPKERPVERVFKDISAWERNKFRAYCGSNPKERPELWYELFSRHKLFLKGKRTSSPFPPFDEYHQELAEFIARYNSTEHERPTLRSAKVVPIEAYKRLYTTRYEISSETLALLLMKAEKRTIGKNGVQCFQKHWSYNHPAMSKYKGKSVEIRYSDKSYKSIKVILPNMEMCEAYLVTPTSLLDPDKETLKVIRNARANERKIIREFELITQSQLRGETIEDRIIQMTESEEIDVVDDNTSEDTQAKPSNVHQLTRLDHIRPIVDSKHKATATDVKEATSDTSIFTKHEEIKIKEFDYDE